MFETRKYATSLFDARLAQPSLANLYPAPVQGLKWAVEALLAGLIMLSMLLFPVSAGAQNDMPLAFDVTYHNVVGTAPPDSSAQACGWES